MPNKFVGAFKFLTQGARKGKVAPTITQPRQLKTTMKRIQSENKKFGFTKAKTATDRANIVRRKKSIERMEKLDAAKKKVKAGEKGKKDIQKMVDTGQADRVGSSVYHRGIRDKKAEGGLLGALKKFRDKSLETPPKPKGPAAQPMKPKDKPMKPRDKRKPINPKTRQDSLREKLKPKKKMDRLKELREELKMKKGGKVKKKFPDLTGDGKVTQADILKGRGVFKKGGGVKQMVKTVTSPITHLRNKLKSRKFGQGKEKGKK